MHSWKTVLFAGLMATNIASCSATAGDIVRQSREVESFSKIHLIRAGELTLVQGDEVSVVVEVEENALEDVKTRVHNGTLELEYDRSRFFQRSRAPSSLHYYVTATAVNGLEISGSGGIESNDMPQSFHRYWPKRHGKLQKHRHPAI